MVHPIDLRELLEARDGRPTEDQAARKIATFAVIPAAIVGLLAGTRLVGIADPIGRLLLVCMGTALASGFGIALLVLSVYYLFGFRPVARLADALVGGFTGFLCGSTLTLLLMWGRLVHHDHALRALLLIPLGAIAYPLYRSRGGKKPVRQPVGQAIDSQTAIPGGAPEPPLTQTAKP